MFLGVQETSSGHTKDLILKIPQNSFEKIKQISFLFDFCFWKTKKKRFRKGFEESKKLKESEKNGHFLFFFSFFCFFFEFWASFHILFFFLFVLFWQKCSL